MILKKQSIRQAAVFNPKEFENRSSANPKAKLIIINVILSTFTGNVI